MILYKLLTRVGDSLYSYNVHLQYSGPAPKIITNKKYSTKTWNHARKINGVQTYLFCLADDKPPYRVTGQNIEFWEVEARGVLNETPPFSLGISDKNLALYWSDIQAYIDLCAGVLEGKKHYPGTIMAKSVRLIRRIK